MKQKIRIVTDSCSSLTKEESEKLGVVCLETSFTLDEVTYSAFEEENVSLIEHYQKLDSIKSCSTGCVNENAFEECFEAFAKNGECVVYIGLCSTLSSTYAHSVTAAEKINAKYGKNVIRTVDSKTGSIGTQILIDDALKLIDEGKNLDEIEFILKDYASKIATTFICRDLSFLCKCGRISALEASVGRLLRIVPLIHVDPVDFKLKVSDKCLGQKLAYKTLKNKFVKLINTRPCERCYIASCGLDSDVEELKNYIVNNTHIKAEDIKTAYIDKTMSCCCGPKTIAIFCR